MREKCFCTLAVEIKNRDASKNCLAMMSPTEAFANLVKQGAAIQII